MIGRIANAMQSMLTRAANLNELSNQAQARLNLGVIQTLAGTVLNTDNCEVIQNANGEALRFPFGIQIAFRALSGDAQSVVTGSWAAPFSSSEYQVATVAVGSTTDSVISPKIRKTSSGGVELVVVQIQRSGPNLEMHQITFRAELIAIGKY